MSDSQFVFEATDDTFSKEVLSHSGTVLVDFWAEWCGPCKALGPVLDSIADEYGNKLKVVKVNVDESPNTPQQYKVRGIPTLILFKNGKMVDQLVGNQPKDTIKGVINKTLS
jgi:thioredoxin 1